MTGKALPEIVREDVYEFLQHQRMHFASETVENGFLGRQRLRLIIGWDESLRTRYMVQLGCGYEYAGPSIDDALCCYNAMANRTSVQTKGCSDD